MSAVASILVHAFMHKWRPCDSMIMLQVRFMDDEEIVCNVNGEETVDDVKRKVSVETGERL